MSRAVMQQALEALEWGSGTYDRRNAAITALKQALSEPQTTHWEGCEAVHPECRKPDTDCHLQGICQRSGYGIAPTPRRPLTHEEIWKCLPPDPDELAFARAIERAHGIGEQHGS